MQEMNFCRTSPFVREPAIPGTILGLSEAEPAALLGWAAKDRGKLDVGLQT